MFLRLCLCIVGILSSSAAFCSHHKSDRIEFVILITSYNNEKWCIGNVESCLNQKYPYFTVYYINDCSTDRTGELVERYVASRGMKKKCKIIHNPTRRLQCANFYSAISTFDPKKVVVVVDGDDRLPHPYVLQRLAEVYSDKSVWTTYGNYKVDPPILSSYCAPFPAEVLQKNAFRKYQWVATHIKTFYAALFHHIKTEDLFYKGNFFPMAADIAIRFPMLEMASRGHIKFIDEVLYIYNVANSINEFKVNRDFARECEMYIRAMPPYEPLEALF